MFSSALSYWLWLIYSLISHLAIITHAISSGGELTATVSDSVLIYGSCLDDWYIHVTD